MLLMGTLGTCVSMAQAQIINVEDKRKQKTDTVAWHETVELGVNLFQNTERVFSVQAAAQVEFVFHNKLLLSITSGTFVRAGEEDFVNQGYQHLRYNSSINDWLTFELFGQVQYNEQARIKIRALGGSGFRFRILEKENERAHFGLSYMYEYDEESVSDIVRQDSRLNTYLSFSLSPADFFTLASTTYFQPLFRQFNDYRLSSSSSAIFEFNDRLSFRTRFTIAYDSRASAGAPATIYALRNSLSYTF